MTNWIQDFRSFSLPARRYLIMHMLGAATMIGYCVYPLYLKELGITIVGVGALYTIADLAKVCFTYTAGRWLDRVGAKVGIILDWCMTAIALGTYAVSFRFWHLVVGELAEKASNLFNPGFAAYENDAFEEPQREKIYAYHMALPYLIQLVAYPLYALLLGVWFPRVLTYRLLFGGCAVGTLLVALYARLMLPPQHAKFGGWRTSLWRRLPSSLYFIVAAELVESVAIASTPWFVFTFLITDEFRGTVIEVVGMHLMFGVAIVICSALTKEAAGRFSNLALAAMGVGLLIVFDVLVLSSYNKPLLYTAFFVGAFGYGVWFPQHQSMKMRLVPEGYRGEFHASVAAVRDLVCMPLPIVAALVSDSLGLKAPFAIQMGLWGICLAIYWRLWRRNER